MPIAPPGTIDLDARVCAACGHTLKASGPNVVCRAGHRYPRLARYAHRVPSVRSGSHQRAAPEPPALQAVLKAVRRGNAAAKERERRIRLKLDEGATGAGLIEWLERQAIGKNGGGR